MSVQVTKASPLLALLLVVACSARREPRTFYVPEPRAAPEPTTADEDRTTAAAPDAGGPAPAAAPEVDAGSESAPVYGAVRAVGDHLELDGQPLVLRGVNGPAPWGATYKPSYRGSLASLRFNGIAKMAALGANAMRIVHFTEGALPAAGDLDKIVVEVKRNRMVPVLGVWDRTCKTSPSVDVEAFWFRGQGGALARAHPELIVNPYNELNFVMAGKRTDHAAWAAYYTDFVQRLRSAGIDNLVMIDTGGACAQNPEGILSHGRAIVEADPLHNVVFSVHMYAFWETHDPLGNWPEGQWSVQNWTKQLAEAGVPVVFGEFGGHDPRTGQNYSIEVVLGSCSDGIDGRFFWMDFDGDYKPFYNVYSDLTWSQLTPIGRVIADWLGQPCDPR